MVVAILILISERNQMTKGYIFDRIWKSFKGCPGSFFPNPVKRTDVLAKELDTFVLLHPLMKLLIKMGCVLTFPIKTLLFDFANG